MNSPTPRFGVTGLMFRRSLCVLTVSAFAVLTSACSQPNEAGDAPLPSASSATAQSTASGTASADASASPVAATATATATAQTAVKKLVSGFPSQAVPLMTGAQIQVSSVEQSGPVSDALVTATVTASTADVLAYYSKVFTDQGFTAQPGDAVDGLPLKTFVRTGGQELVTVSVIQDADTATFTVGATLLQAAFK